MTLKQTGFLVLLLITSPLALAEDAPAAPAPAASAAAPAAAPATATATTGQAPAMKQAGPGRHGYRHHNPYRPYNDKAMEQYRKEMRARYEAHRKAVEEQRAERRALAEKWRQAREKYHEAQMDTWLKRAEDREAGYARRYATMRDRVEAEHNYLVHNHERMLQDALKDQIDMANRDEQLRKQAEERSKRLSDFREKMRGMSGEERWKYMREHHDEVFGPPPSLDEPAPAQRMQGAAPDEMMPPGPMGPGMMGPGGMGPGGMEPGMMGPGGMMQPEEPPPPASPEAAPPPPAAAAAPAPAPAPATPSAPAPAASTAPAAAPASP